MRYGLFPSQSEDEMTPATRATKNTQSNPTDEHHALKNLKSNKNHPLRRPRTRARSNKHKSVVDAKKREHKKADVAKRAAANINQAYSFVYVGNLESFISRERLESMFTSCGPILRIQFRCSRGQAVTVGVAVPEGVRTSRDRQYATIEFKDSKAARNALRLNGKHLDGCQLVVTISPADLPEVQDIIRARLGDIREKQGLPNPYQFQRRTIKAQGTEVLTDKKPDRHHLFGISFAKCVV